MGYVGARAAAEPARVLVHAHEDPGMLVPVAVLDPDRLAFLESLVGLAHVIRLTGADQRRTKVIRFDALATCPP
jgi:hypothetical protein